MNRCKTCVMPDTRPDTAFVDGECAACIAYKRRPTINWDERLEALRDLLSRHGYRCIVPSSGGKDSHYQVIKLKELGAHVTAVTAMTCHPTHLGIYNIQNLAKIADETVIYYPNAKVRAKLNKAGLTLVGDISWPEHVSIFTTPFRAARDLGIPLLFYGENPQNQYGGPMDSLEARKMTSRWVSEFGGFLGLRPHDLDGFDGLTARDLEPYTIGMDAAIEGIEAHFLGQYIPWDSHENAAIACQAGMMLDRPSRANLWAHENLDNAQTGLHDYLMFLKYGYGRGCAQASVDVRAGRWRRADAMNWVVRYDGAVPAWYMNFSLDDVLEKIGATRQDLERAIQAFTNWDLFEPGHPWPKLKEWNA